MCRALVRVKAKIEKNTIFGRVFVRIRSEKEKKHPFFGRAFVRVRAKKNEKHPCGKALARVRAKIEEIILFLGRALG